MSHRNDIRIYGIEIARALASTGPVKVFAMYADGRGFRLVTITEWDGSIVRNAEGRAWNVVGSIGAAEIAKMLAYAATWPQAGTPCAA